MPQMSSLPPCPRVPGLSLAACAVLLMTICACMPITLAVNLADIGNMGSRRMLGSCDKCNLPVCAGGCKCDSNCDCVSGQGASVCDKCNLAQSDQGCKCDNNCDCLPGTCLAGGGTAVNCEVSGWGTCSTTCGGGTQTRTIITQPANGGTTCPALSQACNTLACTGAVNCVVSNWGTCSKTCGGGIQTRTITTQPANGGTTCPKLTRSCNTQTCTGIVNCVVSGWGTCSKTCGGGIRTRSITTQPANGGTTCPKLKQSCNTQACTVNCAVSGWGTCSATCGGGTQTRTITTQPANGGTTCPALSQTCNTQACTGTTGTSKLDQILTNDIFNNMFKLINDPQGTVCSGRGIMTYANLMEAAKAFPDFCGSSDLDTNKRELAAFLGQASQETNGGNVDTPGGWFYLTGGLCFIVEGLTNTCPFSLCQDSTQYPCSPGATYCGRGPLQLSYNYNYGPAGDALGLPLLTQPEIVQNDGIVAWKTSLWFWMTAQPPKPSCHDAIVTSGYGLVTNVINGGVLQCGSGVRSPAEKVKIDFYKIYCDMLGVSYGSNIDCSNQAVAGK